MKEKFTPPAQPANPVVVPMPRYRSHKVVEAAKVVAIDSDALILDRLDGRDQFVMQVDADWRHRHMPHAGGYVVRYEDGYTSFSPAQAFEEGYARLPDAVAAAAPQPVEGKRELGGHRVNPANDRLRIVVDDERGPGGANHRYVISGFDASSNPSHRDPEGRDHKVVLFQNGPIGEVGVNGVTQEALIAILMDRLEGFQRGPFACSDNENALHCLRMAKAWLHRRTEARMERGVEGTHAI